MPPRRYSEDYPVIAAPVVDQIDARIYKLATTLMMMFNRCEEFKNLTDCAYDNFTGIVINWSEDEFMSLKAYQEAVRDWAFASCGRRGYDKIVEMFDRQED